MGNKNYYKAYDERYKQIHGMGLRWTSEMPSAVVLSILKKYDAPRDKRILEIGCGEGRDAAFLLNYGYNVLATDVSEQAITFCRKHFPEYGNKFVKADCLTDSFEEKFTFIYAVAVLHMFVSDSDRKAFYSFIYRHLSDNGLALVCSMGDGTRSYESDIGDAYKCVERECHGHKVKVAATSCRIVTREKFLSEIDGSGFIVEESGITACLPEFDNMLFAVIRKP